ncbi:MAG: aminoacyl-tRNA hydrolase [Anaerolineales bacterium]|nr:aminoacyl-tRNA hydrolase [Anaerolineales bacterium]
MFLIVGLGNPGRTYQHTRHNIGFMALDGLAKRLGEAFSRVEFKALVLKSSYKGQRLVLAKPQTFMNASGQAVGTLMRFYKVPLENMIILYDDVDLPLGSLRIRPGGGSAGQKGMQSIIAQLGTEAFPRLRLGVSRPPGQMDAATYVLQRFRKDEKEIIEIALHRAADAVLTFVTESLDQAMNLYNE